MKNEIKLNLHPNVIDGEELQELFKTVFSQMAYYVSRTYGPFGENTGYQMQDKILTTKDGWTVEQGIIYSNNMLANILRKFIIEVSRSINVHAGDGTTTGIIAANEVNLRMMEFKKNNKIHSKFLSAALKYCVEKICEELNESAIRVTDENMDDIIYRVAEVSLDWDKEYAGFIRDIYRETHNPVIRVQNSGFEKSYVEYTEGYELSAKLISEFKVNSIGTKTYTAKNPIIMVFAYTISSEMFEALLTAATFFFSTYERELVVMAPDFEKDFRDNYNAISIRMAKTNQPAIPLVLARYFSEYNIDREMVNDFCFLTGANIISREYNEAAELIVNLAEVTKMVPPAREMFPDDETYEQATSNYQFELLDATEKFKTKIWDYVGECDTLTVGDKTLTASGFGGLETSEALESRKNIIQAEINKATKDMTAKSMFTEEIKLKKLRLGKLQLKMGTINVGGFGENNLKATRDALDDAINACSNAYLYGVVTGGGIAIPSAICNLATKMSMGEWNPSKEKGIDDTLVLSILKILKDGFIATWKVMLENRYCGGPIQTHSFILDKDIEFGNTDELIHDCIIRRVPWNLITEEFDDSIIHPVKVETEVVKGCLHLVLTTTTTNQILYNGYEGIDKELEGMREVPVSGYMVPTNGQYGSVTSQTTH